MDKKVQEARMLAAAYKTAKMREEGLTQEQLASEFNVTQGLVAAWMSARARIPDATLLRLSERLGFNPLKIRPELADKYRLAKRILTNEARVDPVRELLEQLTDDELSQVELLAEMLMLRRAREEDTSQKQ